MIAIAPASDTLAPAAAARGNGSRSNAAPSTMMKIGVSEFRIEPLVALVYCSPQYCSTLCSPPPAPEGERHRRHQAGERAPRDPVARPEQRGEREQQVGISQSARKIAQW